MTKNYYTALLFLTMLVTQSALGESAKKPSQGIYIGLKAGYSDISSEGHFETGPPIVVASDRDYKLSTYLVEGTLGYGYYGLLHDDMFVGIEGFVQYSPIDERELEEQLGSLLEGTFTREFLVAGTRLLLGASFLDVNLLFVSAGLQISSYKSLNPVSGGGYYTLDGDFEEREFYHGSGIHGHNVGLGYRRLISSSISLAVEYEFSTYNMDQSLKDGAISKQSATEQAFKAGLLFAF